MYIYHTGMSTCQWAVFTIWKLCKYHLLVFKQWCLISGDPSKKDVAAAASLSRRNPPSKQKREVSWLLANRATLPPDKTMKWLGSGGQCKFADLCQLERHIPDIPKNLFSFGRVETKKKWQGTPCNPLTPIHSVVIQHLRGGSDKIVSRKGHWSDGGGVKVKRDSKACLKLVLLWGRL